MKGRFQRGKLGGISPFFAFQDIITSAMAVVITIVMLLAIDMGEPGHASPGERDESLTQQLQKLLDELSQANADLRAAQDSSAAAKLDPALVQGEIDALGAELARLRATGQIGEKTLAAAQRDDGAKVVWSELEKQKAAIATAKKELAQREETAARSLAEMNRAEESVHAKESQLLAERARKNELWLIPDRTKTSKEPVLAVVSADAVILQRFDRPDKSELRGSGLQSKFEGALKGYSKLDQYIVFYFKPSGVEHFQKLTEAAKSAGFEIGYDAVGEEVAINFQPAP
ncbi:MAG: hypothetical protein WDN28_02725 [Chthoniobacter sp.]